MERLTGYNSFGGPVKKIMEWAEEEKHKIECDARSTENEFLRGNGMKYIIDIDAFKDCLDLLPTSYSDIGYINIIDVKKLIDRFPKEEYGNEYVKMLDKLVSLIEEIACNTQAIKTNF